MRAPQVYHNDAWRRSEVSIDPTAMLDGVERDHPLRVVDPEEHTPITDTIFLQTFEI